MDTNLIDYPCSVMVATAIKAEPLRCWRNAVLAILHVPELFAAGKYIEGWIVIARMQSIRVAEHGWCVSLEGRIIDPSIVLIEDRSQPVIYFPGFEISVSTNFPSLLAGKTVPLVCNSQYGRDGMNLQGYQQSYNQAWQQALNLAEEHHLPKTALKVSRREGRRGLTLYWSAKSD